MPRELPKGPEPAKSIVVEGGPVRPPLKIDVVVAPSIVPKDFTPKKPLG